MNEERQKILNMLREGKIDVPDAEELLAALEEKAEQAGGLPAPPKNAKYLRVVVGPKGDQGKGINIRVPLSLLRAGVKFSSLLPTEAKEKIEGALEEKGISTGIGTLLTENIDSVIDAIGDMSIDIEKENKVVRIFCE